MDTRDFYKQVRHLRLTSNQVIEGILAGNYRSVFRGPGLEFDEVREYVPTDDTRFIDWNVTSRMAAPYTKTFREERELVLHLVTDVSASLESGSGRWSKRDTLNILFANLALAAAANNDKVGSVFFSDRVEAWVSPIKGRNHASRLIQDCLSLRASGRGSDLGLALRSAYESMKRRGILVILSDFRASGYWKELSVAARHHDVIAVMITDPLDEDLPIQGLVDLVDPETGHEVRALGASQSFRQAYRDHWVLHRLTWRRECRRRGIETLEISTFDDPGVRLAEFFRRRPRR